MYFKDFRYYGASIIGCRVYDACGAKSDGVDAAPKGSQRCWFFGLFQPIADGVKLMVKEPILPSSANIVIFLVAPVLTFLLSQVAWAVIPFGEGVVLADIHVGLLYIFAVSSLGVYGIITAGWSSNSKYGFLGALRSAAQMVSYKVSIGLILITVLLCVGSLNLTDVVLAQQSIWFCIPLFPLLILFFISCLAETNRRPSIYPRRKPSWLQGITSNTQPWGSRFSFLGNTPTSW